jgi:hypothetical protein
MKKAILTLLVLSSSLLASFAQAPITVQLTRKIIPASGKEARVKLTDTIRIARDGNKKDTAIVPMDSYNLIGGDFTDGKVKFTLVENLKGNLPNSYNLMLIPYKTDTATIAGIIPYYGQGYDPDRLTEMIIIKAYDKEYGATISADRESITLQPLEGTYRHPDIQLYDSLMPDATFKLLDGSTVNFKDYTGHNKYTYIVFWYAWESGNLKTMDQVDQLKNTANLYKNALTVINFHTDTTSVRELDKEKNLDWIEAVDKFDAYFPPSNGRPGGILFNSDGKAVQLHISPEELKDVMNRLLHVTN